MIDVTKVQKEMYDHLDKSKGQMSLFHEDNVLRSLRNSAFKTTGNKDKDREFYASWWLTIYVPDGYGDDQTSHEIWKTWSNATYDLCSYITCSGGYNPKTRQSSVRLSLNKDFDDMDEFKKEWDLFVPLLKETKGFKYVNISEHTLSEWGSYSIQVYSDHYDIIKNRNLVISFTNLEELTKYISENLWYGDDDEF